MNKRKNWERRRRIESAIYALEAGLAIIVIVAAVCAAGHVIAPLIW